MLEEIRDFLVGFLKEESWLSFVETIVIFFSLGMIYRVLVKIKKITIVIGMVLILLIKICTIFYFRGDSTIKIACLCVVALTIIWKIFFNVYFVFKCYRRLTQKNK